MIVSCGVKHIKFWTLSGNTLSAKKGLFKITKTLCIALSVYCILNINMMGGEGGVQWVGCVNISYWSCVYNVLSRSYGLL